MKLFGLVDLVSDFFFGSPVSPGYGKPGSGFTPEPKGVILKLCPICRDYVPYFEKEERLCVHAPGPNAKHISQTACPGSGVSSRWK